MQNENIEKCMIIGVDLGLSGALCLFDQRLGRVVSMADMPVMDSATGKRVVNTLELYYLLSSFIKMGARAIIIENVHAMYQNGSMASFSLGYSKGLFEGLAAALRLRLYRVEPRAWKKHYGLIKVCKEGSCEVARQSGIGAEKYLTLKKHHNRAEAALIAALPATLLKPHDIL